LAGHHPYQALPDYCFWRRSVARTEPDDFDPVIRGKFRIRRSHRIATAGSCFAQHIARRLAGAGFHYLVTEAAHPLVAQDAEEYNYGVFTARYGNIYTSRQLVQTLKRAYDMFFPREDPWPAHQGRFIDPFRPRIQPNGFASLDELLADRRQHLAAIRRAVEQLDVLVFTLGLTETWVSRLDGAALPLCPGVSGGTFSETNYAFINLGVQEVVADLVEAVDLVRSKNPGARFILTVSPVPLVATMEDRSVLVSTTYSKSVLRVAAEEVAARYDAVAYFPSYEIITGSYAKARYFAPDLREVTEAGVSHVMRLFMKHYAEDAPMEPLAEPRESTGRNRRELEEIVAVMCDEVTLDTKPITHSVGDSSASAGLPKVDRNLALGKPANQSSRSQWSRGATTEQDAAGAVDGVITGKFQFHTAEEEAAWWCVDIEEIKPIGEVRIFNRCESESLAARLLPFTVELSADGTDWSAIYAQADGPAPGGADRKPLIIAVSPSRAARYVRVRKHGPGFLHLDQVEIYGPGLSGAARAPLEIYLSTGSDGGLAPTPRSPEGAAPWPFSLLKSLGRSPRNMLHVGANSGQEIEAYKAHGFDWAVLVEPLDKPFKELCQKISGAKNYIAVKALCSSADNVEHDFHVSSNAGASSSMLAPSGHLKEHPEVRFSDIIRLRSTTVDTLCSELQQRVPGFQAAALDFIVLDTQGAELSVLKGADQTLRSVHQIWTEVSHGGLYDNDVALEELQAFLRQYGFRLYFMGIGIHGYGDALFLRN
jgi:FkbM family methyltransferase